jgi:hypothetical protein
MEYPGEKNFGSDFTGMVFGARIFGRKNFSNR